MKASLKVDTRQLKLLAQKLQSPELKGAIGAVPQDKGIAALISQSIADNFQKEGPGWAPLKQKTIVSSLSKALRKKIVKGKYNTVKTKDGEGQARKILQRTRLLYKSVTTPGYSGSSSGVMGSNIYRVEGSKIIWGTSLVYARAQNKGNPKKNVPARPFLVIRDEWMKKITMYVLKRWQAIIKESLGTKTK